MDKRKCVTSRLSAELVEYFRRQGKTLREIGEMMDLGESFVSRVAKGKRRFTIDHLATLEKKLGKPLPLLLLETTPIESVPEDLRNLYAELAQLLRRSGEMRKLPA